MKGLERITVHHGDSREVLRGLPDNSIDSCVCDPPYALVSIVKRFGKAGSAPAKYRDGVYVRASKGFMGQAWDTGQTAFDPAFWAEVLRVLKPGGHLVAFGGTRTYHRLTCAIEDAGFEIRDQIGWAYGSGFPKSHDVGKQIDKKAGAKRAALGPKYSADGRSRASEPSKGRSKRALHGGGINGHERDFETAPVTDAAKQWQGWGTALKPAWEPIALARKPLIGTVAENLLQYGTGAINIDGSRIHAVDAKGGEYTIRRFAPGASVTSDGNWKQDKEFKGKMKPGRWPANLIHDGSDEVLSRFVGTEDKARPGNRYEGADDYSAGSSERVYGEYKGHTRNRIERHFDDAGSAARFFYTAKADAEDRWGSRHPTVKPVDLMAYLCRLVTPPDGVVLDPFAGSGTTGVAALREGFGAVLIEREATFHADIQARLAHYAGEGGHSAAVTQRHADPEKSVIEKLPLFGGKGGA